MSDQYPKDRQDRIESAATWAFRDPPPEGTVYQVCWCGEDVTAEVEARRAELAGESFPPDTTDAVKILHGRIIGGDPRKQAMLDAEREAGGLKDSGKRQKFKSGAVRDAAEDKGRPSLMSIYALREYALHMERGAAKYEDRNWEKGMPLCRIYESLIRHLWAWMLREDDEPHLGAIIWNAAALVHGTIMVRLGIWPAEFDDRPTYRKGKK